MGCNVPLFIHRLNIVSTLTHCAAGIALAHSLVSFCGRSSTFALAAPRPKLCNQLRLSLLQPFDAPLEVVRPLLQQLAKVQLEACQVV